MHFQISCIVQVFQCILNKFVKFFQFHGLWRSSDAILAFLDEKSVYHVKDTLSTETSPIRIS
jgi:hypothetical protein